MTYRILLVSSIFILCLASTVFAAQGYNNPKLPQIVPRTPIAPTSSSSSNGSGINQSYADATYWRVDAGNDGRYNPVSSWTMGFSYFNFNHSTITTGGIRWYNQTNSVTASIDKFLSRLTIADLDTIDIQSRGSNIVVNNSGTTFFKNAISPTVNSSWDAVQANNVFAGNVCSLVAGVYVNCPTNAINFTGSFNVTGNISATYYFGNGSRLKDVCLSNGTNCQTVIVNGSSFNQSYANLLAQNCPTGQVVNGTLANGTFICVTSSSSGAANFTNVAFLNQTQNFTRINSFYGVTQLTNLTMLTTANTSGLEYLPTAVGGRWRSLQLEQQKYNLYESGNTRYGFGVNAGDMILYSGAVVSGQGFTFGAMSTSDGSTFTPFVNYAPSDNLVTEQGSLATGTVGSQELSRFERKTNGGVSFAQVASLKVGRWDPVTNFEPDSSLDIWLKNSSTDDNQTDIKVAQFRSNGDLNVSKNVLANFYLGNGSKLSDVCLANGTNCQAAGGVVNYSNFVAKNETPNNLLLNGKMFFNNGTITGLKRIFADGNGTAFPLSYYNPDLAIEAKNSIRINASTILYLESLGGQVDVHGAAATVLRSGGIVQLGDGNGYVDVQSPGFVEPGAGLNFKSLTNMTANSDSIFDLWSVPNFFNAMNVTQIVSLPSTTTFTIDSGACSGPTDMSFGNDVAGEINFTAGSLCGLGFNQPMEHITYATPCPSGSFVTFSPSNRWAGEAASAITKGSPFAISNNTGFDLWSPDTTGLPVSNVGYAWDYHAVCY